MHESTLSRTQAWNRFSMLDQCRARFQCLLRVMHASLHSFVSIPHGCAVATDRLSSVAWTKDDHTSCCKIQNHVRSVVTNPRPANWDRRSLTCRHSGPRSDHYTISCLAPCATAVLVLRPGRPPSTMVWNAMTTTVHHVLPNAQCATFAIHI